MELLVLAGSAPPKEGGVCVRDLATDQRVSDTGRRQHLLRVAWGQGPAYLWMSLFVVILTQGPGRSFSDQRAPSLVLSPQGADGAWSLCPSGPQITGPVTLLTGEQ